MLPPSQPPVSRTFDRRVLTPILLVVLLLTISAVISMRLINVSRAFVGAQSTWTHARGQACQALQHYAITQDGRDFEHFEQALSVIAGDTEARREMMSGHMDRDKARAGFARGGNAPQDIDDMITAFRLFGDQWLFTDIRDKWIEADVSINTLRQLGLQLKAQIDGKLVDAENETWFTRVSLVEDTLIGYERDILRDLGAASRLILTFMSACLVFLAGVLSLACIWLVRRALQKQAAQQAALELAHERMDLAVKSAGLGLFELDLPTASYHMDGRAAEVHGLAAQACVAPREVLRHMMVEADKARATQGVEDTIASGDVYTLRYQIGLDDGSVRHVESTGRLAPELKRVIGVTRDVTAEVARTQFAAQRDAAEQVAVAQRGFLARLSHELRTPLNAILGFAQLLSLDTQRPLGPAQQRQANLIIQAGRQLLTLIEDVLDLSKVDAGEISMNLQAVDAEQALADCLPMVESIASKHAVHIAVQACAPLPRVQADVHRLQQVFVNLLSNGCKYNRQGGQLTITLRQENEAVSVDFADTGKGLSPEHLAELFQPFKRIHATARHVDGTGLGLYIVKQLVERMGGTVHVHSEVGTGSHFVVRLPLSTTPPHP